MILTIDTAAAIPELGPNTTAAQYATRVLLLAAESWRTQYGGTRDEAIQRALEAAQPDSQGRVGIRTQIRNEAIRRKRDGGFLPALPAGNAKWLPSNPHTMAVLLAYNTAATLPAGLDVQALDGTRYTLPSKARLAGAIQDYTNAMAAIDAAEAAALTAQAANPATFDFSSIAWPPIYTPA
jgi:hypothetical protein